MRWKCGGWGAARGNKKERHKRAASKMWLCTDSSLQGVEEAGGELLMLSECM